MRVFYGKCYNGMIQLADKYMSIKHCFNYGKCVLEDVINLI